jgi:hypothetical protein
MSVNLTAGVKNYVSFHDITNALAIGAGQRVLYGRPYRVINVRWRLNTDTGSTTVSLHKNDSATPTASKTLSPGGANVDLQWLGAGVDYTEFDRKSLSITPTSVSSTTGQVQVDIVFLD